MISAIYMYVPNRYGGKQYKYKFNRTVTDLNSTDLLYADKITIRTPRCEFSFKPGTSSHIYLSGIYFNNKNGHSFRFNTTYKIQLSQLQAFVNDCDEALKLTITMFNFCDKLIPRKLITQILDKVYLNYKEETCQKSP